jgi:hypothetical protein
LRRLRRLSLWLLRLRLQRRWLFGRHLLDWWWLRGRRRRVWVDCLVGAAVSCGGFFTVEELGEGNCELSQPPPSASINCTLEFMACSRRSTAVC